MGIELKASLEKRKYSNEKKVLFLSDGMASWPVAVDAAKEETARCLFSRESAAQDVICLLYPAMQQWNLHNQIEDALKKAEIPKGSIERFGWMFRGGELKYDIPKAGGRKGARRSAGEATMDGGHRLANGWREDPRRHEGPIYRAML